MTRDDFVEPRSQNLPVTRYFAPCIAETMMLESELAAAIASLDGHLKWLQSKSYTDEILGEGFSAELWLVRDHRSAGIFCRG